MSRGGSKTKVSEERRCLIEGSGQDRFGMIRFVLGPDDVVTPDLAEKLGGRGVWVTADRENINVVIAKNLFARSFKKAVKIPENLMDIIETMLVKRLISAIAMARKGGFAIAGADRVKESIQFGKARVLLQASDGSEREKRNIGDKSELSGAFECLTSTELGMAFGRETVVHAALTSVGLKNRVIYEANRLCGIRVLNASSDQKDK